MRPDATRCSLHVMPMDAALQADKVVAAYAQLFDEVAVAAEEGGWALISGVGRARL